MSFINGESDDDKKANIPNDHFSSIGVKINNSVSQTANIEDFVPPQHPPVLMLFVLMMYVQPSTSFQIRRHIAWTESPLSC